MFTNKLKFTLILFLLAFNISVYAEDTLAEIVKVLTASSTKIELENVEKKYRGKQINGRAKVLYISTSDDGILVTLIKEDPLKDLSAEIGVFVRKHMSDEALKLQVGEEAFFSGIFEAIRMNTIIVREGYVD